MTFPETSGFLERRFFELLEGFSYVPSGHSPYHLKGIIYVHFTLDCSSHRSCELPAPLFHFVIDSWSEEGPSGNTPLWITKLVNGSDISHWSSVRIARLREKPSLYILPFGSLKDFFQVWRKALSLHPHQRPPLIPYTERKASRSGIP